MTWAWLLARRLGARGWAVLAAIGAVLYGALRWRGMKRQVAAAEVKAEVEKGRADVAIATHEATVIVDDRQAAGRDVAAAIVEAAAPVTVHPERVAAHERARLTAATASKRAGDRVRAKITTAKRRGGK